MYAQGSEAAKALIDAGHEEIEPVVKMINGTFLMLGSALLVLLYLRRFK